MADLVIKVEGLGKKYRLGSIGTGTLRHDLNRWWKRLRKKEDPYSKIGHVLQEHHNQDEYWALKDINFEVKKGDVLGIIGKNGAGKSSLLKILSRITTPTTGDVKIKGRIASLLEVGTGFHPELTGKENIFLNGAILGMTKNEIRGKLDEIIAFSGVEQYIDTPVKRYSSGMYVRLAFAVAAHLEPEILIIDEVLAVGDAEFQKKCLGKMNKIATEGRTILFVSHNMAAVESLCTTGMVLDKGKINFVGNINDAANNYLNIDKLFNFSISSNVVDLSIHPNKRYSKYYGLQKAEVLVNGRPTTVISPGDDLTIKLSYRLKSILYNLVVGIVIKSPQEIPLVGVNNKHTRQKLDGNKLEGSLFISIPKLAIYGNGECGVDLYFGDNEHNFDTIEDAFFLNLKINNGILLIDSPNPSLNRVYQPNISFNNEYV